MQSECVRQLTLVIPAYNAEPYLCRCLDSMAGRDERLEILIVDDGSTDRTGEIADEYAARYPGQVRVIHKANGGHGSGINVGAAQARGRYFKVIDADDWIVTENLSAILNRLESSDADAAVAGFHKVDMKTGKRVAYASECPYAGQTLPAGRLMEVYRSIPDCFLFHGLFYRTQWYLEHGIRMTEGVFYDDQEYSTLPFAYLNTFLILPEFFYEYMVGNSSQSISSSNMVARIGHIETILRSILRFRREHIPLDEQIDNYFTAKICALTVIYLSTALVKNPDRERGEADAGRICTWLQAEVPELTERIGKKYRMLRWIRALHIPPRWYDGLVMTNFYQSIRKRLMR